MNAVPELTRIQMYLAVNGIVISVLAVVIKTVLVPVLELLAQVVTEVATTVVRSVNWIRKQLGLESKAPTYDPNSKTAIAARQAQFGDLRGYASRAYTRHRYGRRWGCPTLGVAATNKGTRKDRRKHLS